VNQEDPTLALRHGRVVQEAPPAGDAATLPADFHPADSSVIARGTSVGRYLLLDPLGEGGMGVVYSAYDPELDRRIAIKLLRTGGEVDGSGGRSRLLREAQAMARLSHPNVIAVHDVGTFEGSVFVAMELVEGWTLRTWQRMGERTWRDTLELYIAAGRGLAAAHAAGLVHRDFKPDNVLVGLDRRVRVTDFGLVRAAHPEDATAPPPSQPPHFDGPLGASPGASPLSGSLTAAGALLGTPHYMAPEQHRGQLADARSDQFSFCVAAWEALYGDRPFGGETLVELFDSVNGHQLRPPPPGRGVVQRVQRALTRGLAADPAERFPSMDALLAELAEAARRERLRPSWYLLAAALLLGGGAVVVLALVTPPPPPPPCAEAGSAIDATWNPAQRTRLEQAFAATGAPFAADAARGTVRALDAWSASYRSMALQSCKATRVAHTQSEALGDLRNGCLERRLDLTDGLVDRFQKADRVTVEGAVQAAGRLPDLAPCADVAALEARTPLPAGAAARARLDHAGETLAALEAQRAAHASTAELRPQVDALVEEARALGYAPQLAAAQLFSGRVYVDADDGPHARDALLAAAAAALEGGDDETLVAAWNEMVEAATDVLADYPEANRWSLLAEGALARLAAPEHARQVLHQLRGRLRRNEGNLPAARTELERSLALAEAAYGPQHPAVADTLIDLGNIALDDGKLDDAEGYFQRAYQLSLALYGPSHPKIATAKRNLGIVAYGRGRYEDARVLFADALALREQNAPDDPRAIAKTLSSLGSAELGLGRTREALAHLERSLALVEARVGRDHPDVAEALNELGGAYHQLGDYVHARDANLRALAIREKALGPDHPEVGYSLVNVSIEEKALGQLAEVEKNYRRAIDIFERKLSGDGYVIAVAYNNYAEALRVQGKTDAALAAYEHARGIADKALPVGHPLFAHIDNGVGQAELVRGRVPAARAALERALAIREKDSDAEALAETRFALARALVAGAPATRDPGRARTLAQAARAAYDKLGAPFVKQRDAIDAWLTQLPPWSK
jgi:tetratricopeptide (TPR) repeat protein